MASTIAAGTSAGTAIAISGDTSGSLQLQTNGTTTAVTIDTSQNVGIGTSSPSCRLDVRTANSAGALTVARFGLPGTGGVSGSQDIILGSYGTTNGAAIRAIYDTTANNSTSLAFLYGADATTKTEAMRIDSSGNVLVGTASVYGTNTLNVLSLGSGGCAFFKGSNASAYDAVSIQGTGAGTNYMMAFRTGASGTGTQVGGITSTASATSYVTSSDYRLKDNVTPMTGALATVALLKPCNYKWIADGSDGQGFIAHEIQAVVPDCVVGEKDAVDDEGKPKYQGIDTSFLVATLTAAIQEAHALIIQLHADVAALKGVK